MAKDEKPRRSGLGRGLSALMGDEAPAPGSGRTGGRQVPIELLHPNRYQPRTRFDDQAIRDLAASIREKGLLQPILVRPHADRPGEFEIIAGERRWRASQKAQLHQVAIVEENYTDEEALEIALIENVQREDLSPVEEAKGYARLIDEFGHSHEDIATAVGKSRSHVTNLMRLLGLPGAVQEMIDAGDLSMGHARALIGRDDAEVLAWQIVREGLSVREVEALMRDGQTAKRGAPRKGAVKNADTRALEQRLSDSLGLVVSLKQGKGESGSITIKYDVLEQLDAIIDKLGN